MRTPRKFYRRLFLNERGFQTSAHIINDIECSKDSWTDSKTLNPVERRTVDASLRLADCSRVVDLEFYASWSTRAGDEKSDAPRRENARLKALRLQREVNDFVEYYLFTLDWLEELDADA